MIWLVCFWCSLAVLIAAVIGALTITRIRYRRGRLLNASNCMLVGVLTSAVVLFIPIYADTMAESGGGPLETLLLSVHNMIRLFVVDGEFTFITDNIGDLSPQMHTCYSVLFAILFVLAPLLTFGFVLSFFKNISAYRRFLLGFFSDMYVFSEVNEKTLALAESLLEQPGRKSLVFADVFETEEEENHELVERARECGGICFKKDITTLNFRIHSKRRNLFFFALGNDHSENIVQTLQLIQRYHDREGTHVYVQSTLTEAELLLANVDNGVVKVRRFNGAQSLIYRTLYEDGNRIFERADADGKITAVVVGMGKYGLQMTKALPWFLQMDGYHAEIHAYDQDADAASKFAVQCPELMEKRGNFTDDGEAMYDLTVHPAMDVDTLEFEQDLLALGNITYLLVALGDDGTNIRVAVKLRTLFERKGMHPIIQAIVYHSDKNRALAGISDYAGRPYDIDFIGDRKTEFSHRVVFGSDLEAEALKRHLKWGEEAAFWKHEYNYRSSVASALHRRMKELRNIPGIFKAPGERTESELLAIRKLEHRRWNAYMRSEGFCYGEVKNTLAKTHPSLVTFEELSLSEQAKDDD